MWDIIACWPSAGVGEVVIITCPTYFSYFSDHHKGNVILHLFISMHMFSNFPVYLLNSNSYKNNSHLEACEYVLSIYSAGHQMIIRKQDIQRKVDVL